MAEGEVGFGRRRGQSLAKQRRGDEEDSLEREGARGWLVEWMNDRGRLAVVGRRRKTREVVGAIWLGGMDPDGDLVEWRRGWEDGTGP